MIVLETSAVVAIWKGEPAADSLKSRLIDEDETERRISAASYLEAGTVLASQRVLSPPDAIREIDIWMEHHSVQIVPVDAIQVRVALDARIRFGRGFGHPAKLNFGDCFSYALAKTLKAPLLYVGDDFDKTDVKSALRKKRKAR